MYIFTDDGRFEMLLEMSIEHAEMQVMRCFVAHGYIPSYRWVQLDDRTKPHKIYSIRYGYTTGFDQTIRLARLRVIKPSTSLDSPWENIENRQRFPEWEKFMAEAQVNKSDPTGSVNGYYYQWPPLGSEVE